MSDWTSLRELRWSVRSLIAYGAIAFLILTAPITSAALDDQGLPGGIIILGAITIAAVASGYAVYTSLPSRRRARAMEELASSLDLPLFATVRASRGAARASVPIPHPARQLVDRERLHRRARGSADGRLLTLVHVRRLRSHDLAILSRDLGTARGAAPPG